MSYGEVHARVLPHEHEIVHLVTQQHGGCHILVNEGLADIYRGPELKDPIEGTMEELLEESTATTLPFRYYRLAGSFTDHILRGYGMAAIFEICKRAPLGSGHGELEDAVDSVLGLSLPELIGEYESGPVAEPDDYLRMPVTCGDEATVSLSAAAPVAMDLVFDCGADHILGAPDHGLRYQRSIDVVDSREYQLTFSGESSSGESWARILACEPGIGRVSWWAMPEWNGDVQYVTLFEGRYVLSVAGAEGDALSIAAESLL